MYKDQLTSIADNLKKGKTIYVEFTSGARKGSIAKVKSFSYEDEKQSGYWSHSVYRKFSKMELEFEDKPKTLSFDSYDHSFTEKKDYEGPTVYIFTKKDKEVHRIIPKDMIGRDIQVEDLLLYKKQSQNHFGVVTRITDKGTVFVKPVILKRGWRSKDEVMIYDNSDALILNESLRKDLMLKRLQQE